MAIDLRTCKPGDQLLLSNGLTVTYTSYQPNLNYPHIIRYANGDEGSRLDNGRVFHSSLAVGDIVRILRARPTDPELLEARKLLRDLVNNKVVSGMSACIRDRARRTHRSNPYVKAVEYLAKHKET